MDSVTDSADNVLGLIASKFSSPQPDRQHPYGHSKFEAVGALGIASFLGIVCFEILQGAIEQILKGGGEPIPDKLRFYNRFCQFFLLLLPQRVRRIKIIILIPNHT